jgi:hypothetical protein
MANEAKSAEQKPPEAAAPAEQKLSLRERIVQGVPNQTLRGLLLEIVDRVEKK